jgi:hypothetical protein
MGKSATAEKMRIFWEMTKFPHHNSEGKYAFRAVKEDVTKAADAGGNRAGKAVLKT